MDEERWRKFRADFGATGDREALVKEYARKHEHEGLLCYLLRLKTEDEKLVDAATESAEAAKASARTAVLSVAAALASLAATALLAALG
jgi:hypothetical protein